MKEKSLNRFWNKVQIQHNTTDDDCWVWTAAKDRDGYGIFSLDSFHKCEKAHRLSYEHYKGVIPEFIHVCHSCDYPSCINPNHLFLGTEMDNYKDMVSKGRLVQKFTSMFSLEEASDIKNLYRRGMSQPRIAAKYNISQAMVSKIVNNKVKSLC